jgi:hypothetical protein
MQKKCLISAKTFPHLITIGKSSFNTYLTLYFKILLQTTVPIGTRHAICNIKSKRTKKINTNEIMVSFIFDGLQ